MTSFPLSPTFTSIGESWDAIVPVDYVNPHNQHSVTVSVEIDTGASFSLAPVSLAGILGLDLASGTPIALEGVSGTAIQAYLHQLTIRMGDLQFEGIVIAIASIEGVPFLIGRANFWDYASIRIDDVNRQVNIDPLPNAATLVSSNPIAPLIAIGLIGATALILGYVLVKKK